MWSEAMPVLGTIGVCVAGRGPQGSLGGEDCASPAAPAPVALALWVPEGACRSGLCSGNVLPLHPPNSVDHSRHNESFEFNC